MVTGQFAVVVSRNSVRSTVIVMMISTESHVVAQLLMEDICRDFLPVPVNAQECQEQKLVTYHRVKAIVHQQVGRGFLSQEEVAREQL